MPRFFLQNESAANFEIGALDMNRILSKAENESIDHYVSIDL